MTLERAIVIGAGLAGLACAVKLRAAGVHVDIAESTPRAGGRCRSYFDQQIGAVIDNGNHFTFSGNQAVGRWLEMLADEMGHAGLEGPRHADYDFHDLADGARWRLAINDSPLPVWVFRSAHRAPETSIAEHLSLARLALARSGTIADHMTTSGPFWHRVVEPMMLAVLNCPPETGSARLAGRFLLESFARGGKACRTMVASPTLEAAFVEPALRWLKVRGVIPHFGRRLRALHIVHGRVAGVDFGEGIETLSKNCSVILAVPPWIAGELLPSLTVPDRFCAILNAHFACKPPRGAPFITALLGGTAQWVVCHENRISVTISGADALMDVPREEMIVAIWNDVCVTLGLSPATMPRWQIVKEKRATFAATPEQDARRPGARTKLPNLFLAGDWVQTHLPATIEGALRSGENAALMALGQRPRYRHG